MRGQRYQRWWDGLSEQAQPDWSAGAFEGVERSLIPPNGFRAGVNVLTDADGAAYKRGGSAVLSTANFNSTGLRFLLDAYLSAGQRTLFADPAAFGVLDATEGPISLGGAGLSTPKRAAVIGGIAVIGGGTMYAGSRKTANYTTGTVSTTTGSKVVTGAGTTWNTLVDAGMFLRIGTERYYVIASVDSTTQVTLTEAYEGTTAAGKAYTFSPLATAPRTSDYYASGFDRLISIEGDEIHFSRGRSPGTTGLPPVGNLQFQTFDATDLHKLPGGVQGTGCYFLRDTLYVFTTGGVFAVSNMAYDLTDDAGNPQQSLTRISPDLTLWAHEGIAAWGDAMIVPATDGVWLIDGLNPPQKISRSIDARYVGYVRAGHKPGLGQVYRNHYLLPILTSANVIVEVLSCRLDRPQRTALGTIFPWTWLQGRGANVAGFSVRTGASQRMPRLLGAGMEATARVLDCTAFFDQSASVKYDLAAPASGQVDNPIEFDLVTRDFSPTSLNVEGLVRKLRLRYEMSDSAEADPTLSAWYSIDAVTDVALPTNARLDDGRNPYSWPINVRARSIHFRFRSFAAVGKLTIHNFQVFTRTSGKA